VQEQQPAGGSVQQRRDAISIIEACVANWQG
jgi:hypothetical protein